MLNEELYRKQLADAWPEERACAAAHFRGVWCTHEGYDVEDCRDCMKESFAWLYERADEPNLPERADYPNLLENGDRLKTGDWIMVRNYDDEEWTQRQFAFYHSGWFYCLPRGSNLEQCPLALMMQWKQARLPEDCCKNRAEEGSQENKSFMTDYIIKAQALEAILASGELSGETWAAAYNSIKAIPAVDAALVVHAPVSHRSFDDYEGSWQTCGKCHYENNTEDAIYCGGCGAKLDGEYKEY